MTFKAACAVLCLAPTHTALLDSPDYLVRNTDLLFRPEPPLRLKSECRKRVFSPNSAPPPPFLKTITIKTITMALPQKLLK